MTNTEAAITIAVIAAATLFTRAAPFLLFHKKTPKLIEYMGDCLPYAMMGMLVVYCFKSVDFTGGSFGLPEIIAGVFAAAAHKLWHNMLITVGGATILYVALVNFLF